MSHYKWEAWRLGAPRCVNKLYFRNPLSSWHSTFLSGGKKEIPFHVYSRNLFSSERLDQSDCKIQAFQLCRSVFCPISNSTDNPWNFWLYGRQIILENSFLWWNWAATQSSEPLNYSCNLFILIINNLQHLTTKLWKQAFLCFNNGWHLYFSGGRNCPSIRKGRRNPNYMPAMLSGSPHSLWMIIMSGFEILNLFSSIFEW